MSLFCPSGRRLCSDDSLQQIRADRPRDELGEWQHLELSWGSPARPGLIFPPLQVLDVPLTVKIRTGVQEKVNVAHKIIPRIREWGASMVTVRGRVCGVGVWGIIR